MNKFRSILGLVAGIVLLVSSAAHTFLGWKGLSEELTKVNAPRDLSLGVQAGWVFAGTAMFVFGCLVIPLFAAALKGRAVSLRPALLIGVFYVSYGAWALTLSDYDPFFFIFLIPGALLVVGSLRKQP